MGLEGHTAWMIGSMAGFVVFSFLIGWLPLKLGLRQLKNFEA